MPPLAGRPPYATDEPDSTYEASQPTRRIRQHPPEDLNKRTTAYDLYDNYLTADDSSKEANRQSGVGAVGAGLLAMGDGGDDESDSESSGSKPLPSKNAALAAATGVNAPSKTPNQHQMNIAAPRPGYAAPIAALNNIPSPEPAVPPQALHPSADTRAPILNPFVHSSMENPFDPPSREAIRAHYAGASPSPSLPPTPHPLQPPMTPITPVFARPAKPTTIAFEEKHQVVRTERTALPSRNEKGDDFWKRFSMVAKEPTANKESNWLKKTRSGYSQLSRWVWCVGIILFICAVASLGIWFYVAHKSTTHSTPKAIGGSAGEAAISTSSAVAGASTVRHVSPTNTVARRDVQSVVPTGLPAPVGGYSRSRHHKNRMVDGLF
ncbi:hypothetical protein AX15_003771 [Amanita polypyramis BW_CC]|nr:hypothetical protein AX15_003771 [Amanita polypyramis BW_CC]